MLFQDVNICTSALAASEPINCDSEQKMFNEDFVIINLLKKKPTKYELLYQELNPRCGNFKHIFRIEASTEESTMIKFYLFVAFGLNLYLNCEFKPAATHQPNPLWPQPIPLLLNKKKTRHKFICHKKLLANQLNSTFLPLHQLRLSLWCHFYCSTTDFSGVGKYFCKAHEIWVWRARLQLELLGKLLAESENSSLPSNIVLNQLQIYSTLNG